VMVDELVSATRGIEHSANMVEGIALGIAVGVDSAQPRQMRQGLAALQAQLRSAIPPDKIREAMSAAVPLAYSYMYRELADEDLAAYLEFNRSEIGRRYNAAMVGAFTEAMLRASVRMGPMIEKALHKKQA
jgi:hypothetical protein